MPALVAPTKRLEMSVGAFFARLVTPASTARTLAPHTEAPTVGGAPRLAVSLTTTGVPPRPVLVQVTTANTSTLAALTVTIPRCGGRTVNPTASGLPQATLVLRSPTTVVNHLGTSGTTRLPPSGS